jgi:hypothetical protein
MAAPTSHWKLGLFIVASLGLVLGTVLFLGARSLGRDQVEYVTYYDESVQGLDVASPVKLRGVTVGTVSHIHMAQDDRHVEVGMKLEPGALPRGELPADLRVQLVGQGITGVKYLELDFFDARHHPRPALPFSTPPNYVPAAVSTMKTLEGAVVDSADRMPEIADAMLRTTSQLARLMDGLEAAHLGPAMARTLAHMDHTLETIDQKLASLDLGALSRDARKAIVDLDDSVLATRHDFDRIVARIDGDQGLLASFTRTASAYGDLAHGALGDELADTLHDLRQAAVAIARLASTLEIDSDMLVKGRSER